MLLAASTTDPPLQANADLMLTIVQIAVSLGVVTALTTAWRHFRHRRRWQTFKQLVNQWLPGSRAGQAEAMSQENWQILCETLLTDANFSPFEIQQLFTVAIPAAKGLVAAHIREEQ